MENGSAYSLPTKNYISYASISAENQRKRSKIGRLDGNTFETTVVWYKNDLRLLDNPALFFGIQNAQENRTNLIALFVYSYEELKIHGYADCKIALLLKSIDSLRADLKSKLNIPLFVIESETALDVPSIVIRFCVESGAKALYYNHQYELDESARDRLIDSQLRRDYDIPTVAFHDQCVIRPGECMTKQGRHFTVFTPYKNAWLSLLESDTDQSSFLRVYDLDQLQFRNGDFAVKTSLKIMNDFKPLLDRLDIGTVFENTKWLDTERDVLEAAQEFIQHRLQQYHIDRDFPSINGTSMLSPYLALGMISAKYLVSECLRANNGRLSSGSKGISKWIEELCWRDFYRTILVAYPHVCMNKPFKRETELLRWKNDQAIFDRWCHGMTGYPIVDAAMRQLNTIGWMHNRLRMITAMFLTKDLLISWQWGERYFMSKLIDGDFPSNNGGWQWSASTGTDSQPYFRIFNPILQSKRFDPDGVFIKKWIPELAKIDRLDVIHDPYHKMSAKEFKKLGYPEPIVDHSVARQEVIDAFKAIYKK